MKKKAIVILIVVILCLTSMLTVVNAQPTNKACAKSFVVGAGVFLHDESGVTHKHYFDFSVFDTNKKNGPEGTFNLVCVHGKEIAMKIKSDDITSFSVESVKRGLQATFTGSATVKMDNGPWQEGWSFTVTAFDSNGKSKDAIGITLFNPSGQVHCTMEPTPIASGNIAINK
jgi:hypothetical protein